MTHLDPDSAPALEASGGPLLTSQCPPMQRALLLAEGVAPTPATVLLTGESGTGKEIVARLIHDRSDRARRPFVAINCAALPETLVESELFGHERGAFSGATDRRIGRFEAAHRGTLLLDEISEMPLAMQTRLLRVLQEREVQRIGAPAPIRVDVRVIATSNRDLRALVASGAFREDLYYRLNVFPIHLPPLRARMADVPTLATLVLGRLAARFGCPTPGLSGEALERLAAHSYPGNVRELSNVLERALIVSRSGWIEAGDLLLEEAPAAPPSSMAPSGPGPHGAHPAGPLTAIERHTILRVLAELDGNRTHAARRLGISLRTLRNRLREYRLQGLDVPEPTAGVSGPALPELDAAVDAGAGRVVHVDWRR